MRNRIRILSTLLLAAILCMTLAAAPANKKKSEKKGAPASKGAFHTGKYRNLFREAGHSQKEIDAKINAAFQQLFHGEKEDQPVYYEAGQNENGPLAYLTDYRNNDVRSEGMSYGMMIAVQMNRKAEFDALWNWARTYMYRGEPDHPARGFFSWSMNFDGTIRDETPAPDGEEYFTMALYFAANRWGNGEGIYNYKAEADRLIADMLHREVVHGKTRRGPYSCGNMFEPEYKMVRFVPGLDRANFTDPSYHLPAFYELWAQWGPKADSAFWLQAAQASRDFFQKATNPNTGLASDYANFDGSPYSGTFNSNAANFQYDAWRTASNWAVDWSWWAKDPREQQLSDRLQAFFASQGMDKYGPRYSLDGKPLQQAAAPPPGLVAMNAVASLAATHERAKDFVKALWELPVPSGRGRYYDGTLYMMAMLHVSGQFRVWAPPAPAAPRARGKAK